MGERERGRRKRKGEEGGGGRGRRRKGEEEEGGRERSVDRNHASIRNKKTKAQPGRNTDLGAQYRVFIILLILLPYFAWVLFCFLYLHFYTLIPHLLCCTLNLTGFYVRLPFL